MENFFRKLSISCLLDDLCCVIEKNDIEKVRNILSKNPEIVRSVDKDLPDNKNLIMYTAVRYGCDEIIELIIDFGGNVNELESSDSTGTYLHDMPAVFGEFKNFKRKAEILIRRGANVNALLNGITPLELAIVNDHIDYAEFLLENGAKLKPGTSVYPMQYVLMAPKTKQAEVLKLLIKYGLEIEMRENFSEADCIQYIFLRAVKYDIDIIGITKILIDSGVSVHNLERHGISTFMLATDLDNLELLSLLIERGADIKSEDHSNGVIPLSYVVNKSEAMTDFLLSHGVDINERGEFGQTALHMVCLKQKNTSGREQAIKLLIRKGALISAEDFEGATPFSLLDPEDYEESNVLSINTMVQEMAKIKFLNNQTVSKKDMDLVDSHPAVRELFETCSKELLKMSTTKFYTSYSYFFMFKIIKVNKKLVELTKNEEFVSKFEASLHMFTYYGNDLRSIFDEVVKVRDQSLIVEHRLYSIFGDYLPDIVIRKLTANLTPENLPLD